MNEAKDASLTDAGRLLRETGVASAPGVDFDTVNGGSFVEIPGDVDQAVSRKSLPHWRGAADGPLGFFTFSGFFSVVFALEVDLPFFALIFFTFANRSNYDV